MTDWEKLKVTELKEELKSRGIPLTGLKLKQQLIDKLVEIESTNNDAEKAADDANDTSKPALADTVAAVADVEESQEVPQESHIISTKLSSDDDPVLADTTPAQEDGQPDATSLLSPAAISAIPEEAKERRKDEDIVPEQDTEMKDVVSKATVDDQNREHDLYEDVLQANREAIKNGLSSFNETHKTTQASEKPIATDSLDALKEVSTTDLVEDQRKRKRRSTSPIPDTQEISKKAKANDGEAVVTKKESSALDAIKAATAEVQDGRAPNEANEEPIRPMQASDDPDQTRVAKEVGGMPDAPELQDPIPTSNDGRPQEIQEESPEPTRYVPAAIHPATSSIYLRNFKRPLHIPTLRSHISNVARSSSDPDTDPIKLFYLDVIRTHAFISFHSISAASRVRNAMHETRFPDEQMREPLWIDFVPDEKIQSWIDQETGTTNGGFGGGRSSGRKWEVVYENNHDGVEAILRDAAESHARPGFSQQRSSHMSQDQRPTTSIASGIHPDRTALVPTAPRARDSDRNPAHPSQASLPKPKSDSGKGFKALDELFSSTKTKPKLYYKAVPQSLADSRLDMIHDLTTGHTDTGRSGDEGMKRYSFEEYRGREGWVDKGPEFGFGRKGQERLEGFRGRGRGSGGFRGRGRGGDSWRGGR